jgi:transcriptional regulator with XRE-family HTH domain
MEKIGERIRAAREACVPPLSQAELARQIGSTGVQMWRWEAGKRVPRLPMLQRIADALGVSLDDLVREPKTDAAPAAEPVTQ